MSIQLLAKIKPDRPPTVNMNIKPIDQTKGTVYLILPPNIVANQLNTLIPVGTAIIIVAEVKYARVLTSRPTVYM